MPLQDVLSRASEGVLSRVGRVLIHRWRLDEKAQLRCFVFADRVCRYAGPLYFLWRRRAYRPDPRASILNHLLSQARRAGLRLPLITRAPDVDAMIHSLAGRGGLIFTAHTRLTFAAHHVLKERGLDPAFVGFIGGRDTSGWAWGDDAALKGVDALGAGVYQRIATHVRAGGVAVVYVDYRHPALRTAAAPEPMAVSPTPFAFALGRGMPSFFMHSQLADDGVIELSFEPAPRVDEAGPAGGVQLASAFCAFAGRTLGWRCAVIRRADENALAAA